MEYRPLGRTGVQVSIYWPGVGEVPGAAMQNGAAWQAAAFHCAPVP
jgi:hypothetical protein